MHFDGGLFILSRQGRAERRFKMPISRLDKMVDSRTRIKFSVMIVIAMIIWGGSWVSAKTIAGDMPPEALTFWRFFVSFLSILPVMFILREPVKVSLPALGYTLLGAMAMGLYLYFFFKGLRYGFAGAAGVLVTSTMPLVTFTLSVFIFRRSPTGRDMLGLALGLVGGGVLLHAWTLDGRIFSGGNAYFLLCAVLWATLTISSEKAGGLISPVLFSVMTYGLSALLFFFLALHHGMLNIFKQDRVFWLNLLYLGVISSTFATTVYFFASSRLTSNKASSFVFLVPSSAVALSWIFLGETPKIPTIAGGIIAISATYLINKSGRREA